MQAKNEAKEGRSNFGLLHKIENKNCSDEGLKVHFNHKKNLQIVQHQFGLTFVLETTFVEQCIVVDFLNNLLENLLLVCFCLHLGCYI